ncbi:hypothetical protein INS49_010695 [Diaporthe citri]|uniref:uncharacterized protein n=1 Tax=Diaporthe citri TaxID=83186 RepID=UPI001C817296|nr:uncharacterized protein INS49_010695 [Diaporthe citri]KAG6362465.1 hypothetical protein INS49_010695 [Diaporthe citri]
MIHLPDEIWVQIFSHFEAFLPKDKWWMYDEQGDNSSRKTLISISLVSTHFHCLAQLLIYLSVLLGEGEYKRDWNKEQLTRTLAISPELGFNTRTVSFDDCRAPMTTGFVSMLQTLLPSLDLGTAMRRHMEIELEKSRDDPNVHMDVGIAVAMLALMPRNTDYEGSHEEEDGVIEGFRSDKAGVKGSQDLSRSSFANYGLPNLEELRLRTADYRYGSTPIHCVEAALLHANLKTLRLLGSNWLHRSLKLLKWPKEPCGFQFLELRESLVEASSLRHILTRLTSLRTLIIHIGDGRRHDEDDQWALMLDEFGSILRKLGQDLVELSLHTNNSSDYLDGTGEYEGYLGSLIELRSLSHLSVVIQHLVDDFTQREYREEVPALAGILPPSLETLHLHYDGMDWDTREEYTHRCSFVNGAVRKLLEHGQMHNLRRVSIERYFNYSLEGEFDGQVAGWDMTVENVHLDVRMSYSTSRFRQTMVTFTRRG